MKRLVLGFVLTLAALGLMTSPAMGDPGAKASAPALSVEDQAFIASLAPAPELAAKRPTIGPKATCTANCWNGGTVTCTAASCTAVNGSCPGEPGHVTCDGVTTWCSAVCPTDCTADPYWCTEDCDALCACGGTLICNTNPCTSHCRCNRGCPQ